MQEGTSTHKTLFYDCLMLLQMRLPIRSHRLRLQFLSKNFKLQEFAANKESVVGNQGHFIPSSRLNVTVCLKLYRAIWFKR